MAQGHKTVGKKKELFGFNLNTGPDFFSVHANEMFRTLVSLFLIAGWIHQKESQADVMEENKVRK